MAERVENPDWLWEGINTLFVPSGVADRRYAAQLSGKDLVDWEGLGTGKPNTSGLIQREVNPADEAIWHEEKDWTTNEWLRRGGQPELRHSDQE